MNESEFDRLAEDTMFAIEEAVDASGADIDYDTGGGVLTLEFSDGRSVDLVQGRNRMFLNPR